MSGKLAVVLALLFAIAVFLDKEHFSEDQRDGVRRWLGEVRAWLASDGARPPLSEWWSTAGGLVVSGFCWAFAGMLLYWGALTLNGSNQYGQFVSPFDPIVETQFDEAEPEDVTFRWWRELRSGPPKDKRVARSRLPLSSSEYRSADDTSLVRRVLARDTSYFGVWIRPSPYADLLHGVGVVIFAAAAGLFAFGWLQLSVGILCVTLIPLGAILIFVARPVLTLVFGAASQSHRKPFSYLAGLGGLLVLAVSTFMKLFAD